MPSWMRLCVVLLLAPFPASAAGRYSAMFSDGSRAEEAEIRDWNGADSPATIGGKRLFDDRSPIRWILDRNQTIASMPVQFVEFEGGDRLAGEVIEFSDGRENPYEASPPHLIVNPVEFIQPADVNAIFRLRVSTEWVRRVVWQQTGSPELQPGTVWLRTGIAIPYRTVRWGSRGITLLTSDGVKEIPFAELGEIHLPKLDPWNVYYDQLSALSPQLNSRLVQIETAVGSVLTTSMDRFQARFHGDRNRPEQWFQLIQPAWSLDSLWIRYRTIRCWRFHSPLEVPLSRLLPSSVRHEPVFGQTWGYRQDQNAVGGPLRSRDQEFGWGFGVHGTSTLTFEYPVAARALRTSFGLDRSVEEGGCVDVEITAGNGHSLLKHVGIIGSSFVGRSDWMPLPSADAAEHQISFGTDMAHVGRPTGTDPYDIRDVLNWYEPEIQLDADSVASEIHRRTIARLAGLTGWTSSSGDSGGFHIINTLDASDPRDPQFRLTARPTEPFAILSRKVKVGPADRWFVLAASRFPENTSPTTVQIRAAGRVLGEFEIPIRVSMADPEPMMVPIDRLQGTTIPVEIVVFPTDEKSWVDWRGFTTCTERPGLLPIFEDDDQFAVLMNQGEGQSVIDNDNPFSGNSSLRVTTSTCNNPTIPSLRATICEHPRLGEYRYVLFAWKKKSGDHIQIQFANQGEYGESGRITDRPSAFPRDKIRRTQTADERGHRFRYCYEAGAVTTQSPFPLWLHGNLPKTWQLTQRDLFGDFGSMQLTGLSLNPVDGDAAWFDHIYLARTNLDLAIASRQLVNPQPAAAKPDEQGVLQFTHPEDFPAEISRVAPLFSTTNATHGIARITEFNGQTDVVRTHPNSADQPLILRAGVLLPVDPPMSLEMQVSHAPNADWQLIVRANGNVIHDQIINETLTQSQEGWARIQVDLSPFAGQKVLLEVLNQSNDGQNESAYWKSMKLVRK